MFATTLRKLIRWKRSSSPVEQEKSLLLVIFMNIVEDLISWKRPWLSTNFLLFCNAIFFIFSYQDTKFSVLLLYLAFVILSIDAMEAWLKYKHRTSFLKQLAYSRTKPISCDFKANQHMLSLWKSYLFVRETNHTKVFLVGNIIFGLVYIIGNYVSGFMLTYLLCMAGILYNILLPFISRLVNRILINTDFDSDIDSLIPEVTEKTLQDLAIEPEKSDNRNTDNWKPEDEIPTGDLSDSSETSSSITTHFSIEKLQKAVDKIDTSDSSDADDEYIPLVKEHPQLKSTVQVIETPTWGMHAINAFQNLTGAVSNIVQAREIPRQRLNSADSSDGFEFIDRRDYT